MIFSFGAALVNDFLENEWLYEQLASRSWDWDLLFSSQQNTTLLFSAVFEKDDPTLSGLLLEVGAAERYAQIRGELWASEAITTNSFQTLRMWLVGGVPLLKGAVFRFSFLSLFCGSLECSEELSSHVEIEKLVEQGMASSGISPIASSLLKNKFPEAIHPNIPLTYLEWAAELAARPILHSVLSRAKESEVAWTPHVFAISRRGHHEMSMAEMKILSSGKDVSKSSRTGL